MKLDFFISNSCAWSEGLIKLCIALAVSSACSMTCNSVFLTPLSGSKYFTTSGNIVLVLWLEASVPIVIWFCGILQHIDKVLSASWRWNISTMASILFFGHRASQPSKSLGNYHSITYLSNPYFCSWCCVLQYWKPMVVHLRHNLKSLLFPKMMCKFKDVFRSISFLSYLSSQECFLQSVLPRRAMWTAPL